MAKCIYLISCVEKDGTWLKINDELRTQVRAKAGRNALPSADRVDSQSVKTARGDEPSFTVIPKRWVVERTYAWFGHYRRLSKDYEFLSATSEMMLFAAMVRRLNSISIFA